MAMTFGRYIAKEPETYEEVQQRINALTHTEFMQVVASYLSHAGLLGTVTYTYGGHLTPNAMVYRAMTLRLARINGDIETEKRYLKEFAERDERMRSEAKEAADTIQSVPETLWIDSKDLVEVRKELSITRCLLTTYPVSGCVPLRTLTPEELKALEGTPL